MRKRMLGLRKPRRLDEPIAVSRENLFSTNHFYRHLETRLDLSFADTGKYPSVN
jgi:hypothetical protein